MGNRILKNYDVYSGTDHYYMTVSEEEAVEFKKEKIRVYDGAEFSNHEKYVRLFTLGHEQIPDELLNKDNINFEYTIKEFNNGRIKGVYLWRLNHDRYKQSNSAS